MKFSVRVPLVACAALFIAWPVAPAEQPASSAPAFVCPVTTVKENGSLRSMMPPRITFEPGGGGFVDSDGALGMKVGWERKKKGKLNVGGRRLDGEAKPARAYLYDYGDEGFQPTYVVFPTPGCWKIVGRVGDNNEELAATVFIRKIGDGPSAKFDGLGKGWRVTSIPVRAK
jgi:hypothetical protein